MEAVTTISLDSIRPGNNDRTRFDQARLIEMAASISDFGLLQPITVRPAGDGYEIVAGERRFRACQLLGLATVPCLVRDLTDEEAASAMLLENVARADLDPLDEARAYQSRMDQFGWSVNDCAQRAGVSAVRVRFRLKLLSLSPTMVEAVTLGILDLGYAQILADGQLDSNRQTIAFGKLRDNPSPTPHWFRQLVGELACQQQQEDLFAGEEFAGAADLTLLEVPAAFEPPTPGTTGQLPAAAGADTATVLRDQRDYWQRAAIDWARRGKNFKRDQCLAAAQALNLALRTLAAAHSLAA